MSIRKCEVGNSSHSVVGMWCVLELRQVCIGLFFFFQAEDGIRDYKVTGVQTCALPISCRPVPRAAAVHARGQLAALERTGPCDVHADRPVPARAVHGYVRPAPSAGPGRTARLDRPAPGPARGCHGRCGGECPATAVAREPGAAATAGADGPAERAAPGWLALRRAEPGGDRKSTRLNSRHPVISYARL